MESPKERILPWNEELLNRIENLDMQIAKEISKEKIDEDILALLTRQRKLVFETLTANWVNLSEKGILETDQMIEKLLSDLLSQEATKKKPDSEKFVELDEWRKEEDTPIDYRPTYPRMDDDFNPEIPSDNLYNGEKISYPSSNDIKYTEWPDGSIIVSTETGKKYVTDPEWNDLFEGEYDEIITTDNWYIVKRYNKRWVYDTKWKKIIKINYDSITVIKWWYKVKNSFWFWIILNSWKRLLIPKYEDIKEIEWWYKVKRKGKWWVVDLNWKEVVEPKYDSIEVKWNSYECKKWEETHNIDIPHK